MKHKIFYFVAFLFSILLFIYVGCPSTITAGGGDTTSNISSSAPVIPQNIQVKQNAAIIDNSTGTYDFGSQDVNTTSSIITFTIINLNDTTVDLNVSPISISGTDAVMFNVTQPAQLSLGKNASTTFTIQFAPTSRLAKSAIISIGYSLTKTYTFNITGTGLDYSITVLQGTTTITNSPGYNFGYVENNATSDNITFTITNNGDLTVDLTGSPIVNKASGDTTLFNIVQPVTTQLVKNASTTFTIQFAPTSTGSKTLTNNIQYSGSKTYNFTATGYCPLTLTYRNFESRGDTGEWAWSNPDGTISISTAQNHTASGSKSLLFHKISSAWQGFTFCNEVTSSWDFDFNPTGTYTKLILWVYASESTTFWIKFTDNSSSHYASLYTDGGTAGWTTPQQTQLGAWKKIILPLSKFVPESGFNIHDVNKIEIVFTDPGDYYIDDVYITE